MSSQEETPCDSNDYQLTLYSALLDDDAFTLNILPCANSTSGVVINDEDGAMSGVISSGGGGESSVEATVASRTTPAMVEEENVVVWETTAASTSMEVASTSMEAAEEVSPAPGGDMNESDLQTGGGDDKPSDGANEESNTETVEESTDEQNGAAQEIHEESTATSTFYTCHPNPASLISGDFAPDDTAANKIEIIYDYELLTVGEGDAADIVAYFEDVMTQELANQFGLVDCQAKVRRRGLRKIKRNGGSVVALDSDPADELLEGQCELSSLSFCIFLSYSFPKPNLNN
jgi:hypothetical protein